MRLKTHGKIIMSKKIEVGLVKLIAESLSSNNFEAVFNVPGFGGSEVLESIKNKNKIKTYINLNEEAAFSISFGVSSNGKRSALLIKSQGFAKAMNAVTSSMSTEASQANLIFIFDDSEGRSSDNIIPIKNIVKSIEIPFLSLGNSPSEDIATAIRLSEKQKMPVAIIVDCKNLSKLFNSKIMKVPLKKTKPSSYLERVACPVLTKYQRERLKSKFRVGDTKIQPPRIDDIRKVLPERLQSEMAKYESFMNVFMKHRPSFVSGDAGTSSLFAFKPFCCIDTCTYMGGSPGMAVGAMIAGIEKVVSVTGDFSFLAAGILGFNEAILHNFPLKIIIFNNGKAHATGGQLLNPALLQSFRRSFQDSIIDLNLAEAREVQIENGLVQFLNSKNLSILMLEV